MSLLNRYQRLRARSEAICAGLEAEDFVVQPVVDVSPPKWHLGHVTWFFETFVLGPHAPGYAVFDARYDYVFNSYYESVGARVVRTDRGNLSRPTVADVRRYRAHVDRAMADFLADEASFGAELRALIVLGLHHEEQHQELLVTDIKYILGNNPLLPGYPTDYARPVVADIAPAPAWQRVEAGVYEIGATGTEEFFFDNEGGRHKVYLPAFEICRELVTNAEFLAFIDAGGYADFRHWHADGWNWVKAQGIAAPLYWHHLDGAWQHYTPRGLEPVPPAQPVCHLSYYEAWAFAQWRGLRLPTEAEWEVAQAGLAWGARWEWTESAYLPYPGFAKAAGAIGEYNGKFMVDQMVLRGASEATTPGHGRPTYRNFFQPPLRWQFTGLRLARSA